ncbi:hypothetical protein [Nocardioides coralli]|uniref:hypothetical protein n=1 Tax=Nocardioides coralli TaxID=2872154 RepID=UPI001CA445B5|nr:hypothetical protein [Nocardioides coralli]QZY29558.1 hypothetical protein K6T13_02360 [Nocardioides coralli]
MGAREAVVALAVAAPFALGLSAASVEQEPQPWFRFEDPAIVESSGVALVFGMMVTVNDSGDEARLFVVDPETGETVGTTRWDAEVEDVEALAPALDGRVWVGDIGDNAKARDTISLTRLSVGSGDLTVAGDTFELAYPDGPADAEALLAHPTTGRLVVVTKNPLGGRFFLAPRSLDPRATNELRPRDRALPLVTGGEFFPDGRHLVLRNYGRAQVYSWPGLQPVGDLIDLPSQEQGEALTVLPDGTLVLTSEGARAPVLRVPLPASVTREVGLQPTDAAEPSPLPEDPSPSTRSRVGEELPEEEPGPRDPTQWLIGGGILAAVLLVLWRALRPR